MKGYLVPELKSTRAEFSDNRRDYQAYNHAANSSKRSSPRIDSKGSFKNSPRVAAYDHPTSNSRIRLAQSRQTTDQASDHSDYSHSQQSEGRSSRSRSVKSRGISLNRDDSIERKLDTYMKNRKVASRTAVRLSLNTLITLDTILWKVTSTHHVG